jgi:hypothetical protein
MFMTSRKAPADEESISTEGEMELPGLTWIGSGTAAVSSSLVEASPDAPHATRESGTSQRTRAKRRISFMVASSAEKKVRAARRRDL